MFLTSVVQGESKSSQCPTGAAVQTSTFTHGEAAPPPVYKVVTVGGGGVGKSSLVVQFMYGEVIVHNKHQSNLVKSGIVFRFYLSNMQLFWLGFRPPIFPSLGVRDRHLHNVSLDLTSVPAKWQLNSSNGLSRVHECDRRQTDRRQTTPRI